MTAADTAPSQPGQASQPGDPRTAGTAGPELTAATRSSLHGRVVSGALWNYGSFGYLKLTTLLSTAVLAHKLSPAEFGLVGLALIIINYLDTINDFGISAAVIYEKKDDDATLSVAFWLTQATGLLAFGVCVALAPLTARLFHQPRLFYVQIVLGLVFVLSSIGDVHDALLRRRLQWRRRMPADFGRTTAKAAVAIALALAGFGAWSLVYSQLAAAVFFSVVIMFVVRWRPRFVFDRAIARRQLHYGSQVMLTTVIASVLKDADYFMIGIFLTTRDLGFYTLGFRLPDLAIMGITWSLSSTMFPVFSRLRDQPEALRRAVVKVQRLLAIVLVPLGVFLAVGATRIVFVLYGPGWHPTAGVTPYIAAYSVMYGFAFVGGDAFKAMGKVALINKVAGLRLPLSIAALAIAAPHGIFVVAETQLALMTANFVVQVALTRRVLNIQPTAMLGAMVPGLLGSCVLAAVMLASFQLHLSALPSLLIGGGLGFAGYLGVVLLLERRLFSELAELFRNRRSPVPA